jgi:hypothetical protein
MRIQRHGNRGTTKSGDMQVGQRSNSRGNIGISWDGDICV